MEETHSETEAVEDIQLVKISDAENKHFQYHMKFHFMSAKLECEHNRDAFWRIYRKFKRYSDLLSVPLLVASSATGITSVTSVSQFRLTNNVDVAPILTAIFGVSTAVLSSLQKYFRYSERAENCKYIAKSYNRLSKKIKYIMTFIDSESLTITSNDICKFMEDINKEMISLSREIDEQPIELIKSRLDHVKVMQDLKTFYVTHHPMKKGDTTINIPSALADIEI